MNEATAAVPVTSNMEAAQLAIQTERNRVLGILALADPPVAGKLIRAIDVGTPLAQAKRITAEASVGRSDSQNDAGAAGRTLAGSKWSDVIRRQNERQRSTRTVASSAKSG